jgi:nifR3 family TIM-barrel protein
MNNFWSNLKKPIFCLAPMENVTDFAFREMFARYSKTSSTSPALLPSLKLRRASRAPSPGLGEGNNVASASLVMFTEFINVDGLTHPEGRKKLSIGLKYSEAQRPVVAQIWGRDPEKFCEAAKIISSLKFDGIDINMGCPQSKEIRGGACAALIREPELAQDIIAAAKQGAGDLPVSVKTRIGYSKTDEMGAWVESLLEMEIAALILHGRTKQEKSAVPAHWDLIAEAVKIRNKLQVTGNKPQKTLIIGNGDIKSFDDGLAKIAKTKVDGVMIGRGAFGNPWIFNLDVAQGRALLSDRQAAGLHYTEKAATTIGAKEKLRVMLEHAELFEQNFAGQKGFPLMRKHFKAYCSGFPGAQELRARLMRTKNLEETRGLVEEYIRVIGV